MSEDLREMQIDWGIVEDETLNTGKMPHPLATVATCEGPDRA